MVSREVYHCHPTELTDEQVQDSIVVESFEPVLDLYLSHPDWGTDIELQAYFLEVLAERHPQVLEKLRALGLSGQAEVVSFHYSDQIFIAYPRADLEHSLEMTREVFERYDIPLSRSVFCQEGQAAPGMAAVMKEHGYEYLIGCASVSMADSGHLAASLYGQLSSGPQSRMAPEEYRVFPRCPLHLAALRRDLPAEPPPLIKGYLRAGAWVCGDPAWDPDFNTADLPLLLPMARLSDRYARHFLGEQGGGGTSVMNG